jgi:hypothetical protein
MWRFAVKLSKSTKSLFFKLVLVFQNGNACGPGYALIRLQALRAWPVPVSIPIASGPGIVSLQNSQVDPPHAVATLVLNEAVLLLDSNFLNLTLLPVPAQPYTLFSSPGAPSARL